MKVDYKTYLASREWRLKRKEVIEDQWNRCGRCQATPIENVHHLHYKTVGYESPRDLQGLCRPCHEYVSGERDDDPAATVIWALIEEHGLQPEFHPDGYLFWWFVSPGDEDGPLSLSVSFAVEGSNYHRQSEADGKPVLDAGIGTVLIGLWM